jgi:outer membrane immunogenic protein
MKVTLIAAGAAAALLFAAPAAFADSPSYAGTTFYGDLGYTNLGLSGYGNPDISAITGRLGARFGEYLGVEGEATGGLNNDHVNIGGTTGSAGVSDQYAAYAVGYLPVMPNADILARIGYGNTDFHTSVPGGSFHGSDTSWNFGVGGQYFFDGHDGVRVDYTRADYEHGPDANIWGVSYVRKF